jgi:heme/copper-type cytochrome/quinol oxidase subunit 2
MGGLMQDLEKPTQRKASFGATLKAVCWSFCGIRKKSDYEKDAAQLNPVHVIIAGLIAVLIFIVILVTVVKIVVAK